MKSDSGACICEYHDPSGVFPLISQQLQSRLPLRNLNWKSGDRPVRSIDSLHVDFREATEGSSSRPQSSSSTVGQDGQAAGAPPIAKERRHQIPGLRQTPYLKLYLLRCDDVETYRESSRKALREWLKTHTPPSQKSSSSAQENHDAFEWMLVHVILPNTAAAAQPRYSKKSKDDEEEPNPKPGKTRLKIGKSSNTILEKIKADFNVSSKSAPDRVAQVRLSTDEVPSHILPSRSTTDIDYPESPQEKSAAWQDSITKLRNLILASFDLRVRQYEDDIRERGSQRALPGWNFCTFFVLKEGLARGFESVGLLDDALLGYDELGAELDAIIREPGLSTVFLPFTDDLSRLLDILRSGDESKLAQFHWQDRPISATRMPYREMILANQISIFDFRCYIFARQMEILLRMGFLYLKDDGVRANLPQDTRRSSENPDVEDVAVIAEVCRRASLFVSETSPALAQEISEMSRSKDFELDDQPITNMVSSWIFAVARQVVKASRSPSLLEKVSIAERDFTAYILPKHEPSGKAAQRLGEPNATTMRPPLTSEMPIPIRTILEGDAPVVQSVSYEKKAPEPLYELARKRCDLLLLQRQIVEKIANVRAWPIGWDSRQTEHDGGIDEEMQDIGLDDKSTPTAKRKTENTFKQEARFICVTSLAEAVSSEVKCRDSYERLTRSSITHSLASEGLNTVRRLLADLAVLKYQSELYATASHLLSIAVPVFDRAQWTSISIRLLATQADCLRQLGQQDEYVKLLLEMMKYRISTVRAQSQTQGSILSGSLRRDDIETQLKLDSLSMEILDQANSTGQNVEVHMEDYFTDIAVDPCIRQLEDQDGFQIRLRFKSALFGIFEFRSVRLHLRGTASTANHELTLLEDRPTVVKQGLNTIVFKSHTTASDEFIVDRLSCEVGKIHFVYDGFERSRFNRMKSGKEQSSDALRQPLRILSYPKPGAFRTTLEVHRDTAIDKIRSLDLTCFSGYNAVQGLQVRLRAATGGLRIRTGEARLSDASTPLSKKGEPGVIELPELEAESSVKVIVPYDLEGSLPEITVCLEVTYQTEKGVFELITAVTVRVALPLDVSVHDLFKESALFSKFNIRTADNVPMQVLDAELQGSDAFKVEGPPCRITPVFLFAKQPIPILYKVHPLLGPNGQTIARAAASKERPLSLRIKYRQMDEVITEMVRDNMLQYLATSDIKDYSILIEETLLKKLPDVLSIEDLAQAAMLQEVSMPTFAAMKWNSILRLLPEAVAEQVRASLENWHQQNTEIALDPVLIAKFEEKLTHTLTITVPLPRVHVLHTASLRFSNANSFLSTGQLQTATLTLKNTQRWDSPNTLTTNPSSSRSYVVEIDAPPDQWLIGGMRRFHITPAPEETSTFPVMLIPLKPGRLPLPTVDLRFSNKEDVEKLSCATDFVDFGKTVMVVNDVGEASVRLMEGMQGTEIVVTEIEGRSTAVSG